MLVVLFKNHKLIIIIHFFGIYNFILIKSEPSILLSPDDMTESYNILEVIYIVVKI